MVQTKKGNPVHYMPYTYLMNEDLDTWTQSHNGGRCYGAMTTNMSQCFNGVLKGSHDLPIAVMVEFTWCKLVAYFNDQYREITSDLSLEVRCGVNMPMGSMAQIYTKLQDTL